MDFNEYKEIFNKYFNRDLREINFQDELVKRLLQSLDTKLDIENCSNISSNNGGGTEIHDPTQYFGLNEENIYVPADLVISKNWNYDNRTNDVGYIALVEVKIPYKENGIYSKNYKDYNDTHKNRIKTLLNAKKVEKLIFTDTLKWEFYKDNSDIPIKTISLFKLTDKRGHWNWEDQKTFNLLKQELKTFITE